MASGAGAASIACLNLLLSLGMKRENITVCDSKGVVYKGRDDKMDQTKKSMQLKIMAGVNLLMRFQMQIFS